MNLSFRQKARSETKIHQPEVKTKSLPELFYLLDKSLNRYGYLQKHGAPDVILDAEKDLFLSRLDSLRTELKK